MRKAPWVKRAKPDRQDPLVHRVRPVRKVWLALRVPLGRRDLPAHLGLRARRVRKVLLEHPAQRERQVSKVRPDRKG